MVSRGGRSRGCAQCRRRRVKCDETLPTCKRCEKRGLSCEGPKPVTWIHAGAGSSSSSNSPTPDPDSRLQLVQRQPVYPNLSLSAFQDGICLSYTRQKLLRGGVVSLALSKAEATMGAGRTPTAGQQLLEAAVMSLSTTFFGSQHRQAQLTVKGYQMYGAVLKQLNATLAQPHLQTANDTVLSVTTCILLELFLPTGHKSFLEHLKGLEAILAMRGPPSSERLDEDYHIYHSLRLISVIGSLASTSASVYSRKEWKREECLFCGKQGKLRHAVFDVMADCTRLLSLREEIRRGNALDMRDEVIEDAERHLEAMEAFQAIWVQENARQLQFSTESFGDPIVYANHASANTHLLYSLAFISITDILESLQPSPRNKAIQNAAALNIAYCLESDMYAGPTGNAAESDVIAFMAIKIAWRALGGFSSFEGRRLAAAVSKTVERMFAVGSWQESPQQSPRLNPKSPNRMLWMESSNEPF